MNDSLNQIKDVLDYLLIVIAYLVIYFLSRRRWTQELQILGYPAVLSNKYKTEYGTLSCLKVTLNKSMPNIFIDNLYNYGGDGNPLDVVFNNEQQVKLEGNFSDNFKIYIPKNMQILALSLLTPDMMQTLMQSNKNFDIIIDNKDVYIFRNHDLFFDFIIWPKIKNELIMASNQIIKELEHKLKSWPKNNEVMSESSRLEYLTINQIKARATLMMLIVLAILLGVITALKN